MTFSYNPALLTTPLNEVRLLLQDTVSLGALFQDEEITGLISLYGDKCLVVGMLARQKAAKLAALEETSRSIGDLSISQTGSADYWRALAPNLEEFCRSGAGNELAAVGIGPNGLPWEELPHIFRVGQHDRIRDDGAWSPWPGLNYRGDT